MKEKLHSDPTPLLSCPHGTELPAQNISRKVDGWLLKTRVDAN